MESIIRRLRATLPPDLPKGGAGTGTVMIERVSPEGFWADLLVALEHGHSAALLNPGWPTSWMETMAFLAGTLPAGTGSRILVPTSGSTGLPKFCTHTVDTLMCAAEGFRKQFEDCPVPHSVNVLPQHHIGGLMPVFRSACCGGHVHFADYREVDDIAAAPFSLEESSISLVPTQLRRMRQTPGMVALLKQFALILVGGASCPSDLLDWARREGLRLSPCYGSTETAAMVTMLPCEAFREGMTGVGFALPHASIKVLKSGLVSVQSESLFHGYLPVNPDGMAGSFVTGDIGEIDQKGNLKILGRADRVIISGGENVHPELVENAAMQSGLLHSAVCRGVEDSHWGARIELWVEPVEDRPGVMDELLATLTGALPPYARPKRVHLKQE